MHGIPTFEDTVQHVLSWAEVIVGATLALHACYAFWRNWTADQGILAAQHPELVRRRSRAAGAADPGARHDDGQRVVLLQRRAVLHRRRAGQRAPVTTGPAASIV